MRIVIDIPEEVFDEIYNNNYYSLKGKAALRVAVRNGIPLPKGHGRLGDLDALETKMVNGIRAGNYEEGYEHYPHINNMDDCVECVKYADTLIEADEGGQG